MSTRTPARVDAGVPDGGQFAASARAEADVDLATETCSAEAYPEAVAAMMDDMADDVPGERTVYEFAPDVRPAVREAVAAFVTEHGDDIAAEVDDSDDGGWMVGRDLALARNNPPGTPHARLAFAWMKDPARAAALRDAAHALGPLRLVASEEGTLHLPATVPLPPTRERSIAASDPGTDPVILDRIARYDYRDPAYSHWDKVIVAANPSTRQDTIEHIRAPESEPEFARTIAQRPTATPQDLAWAATSYDSTVRAAVLAHPGTSEQTHRDLAATVETELAEATRVLSRSGVHPMRNHEQWQVETLTKLKVLADQRTSS